MLPLVMALVAVLLLPALGAALAWAQIAYYRIQVRRGRIVEDDVPFFGVLLMRGMLAGFIVVALIALSMPRS
jgi:hypothetical protein